MTAGATAFTRMPASQTSLESALVIPIRPALAAEYGTSLGFPSLPATEAMLMMRPHPSARMIRHDRPRPTERSGQEYVQDGLPVVVALLLDTRSLPSCARVIDQNPDRTDHFGCLLQEPIEVSLTSHVPDDHERCRESLRHLRQLGLIPIEEHQPVPVGREALGDRSPDASSGTCYDSDPLCRVLTQLVASQGSPSSSKRMVARTREVTVSPGPTQ